MNLVEAIKSGRPWKRKGAAWSWREPIVRVPGYNQVSFELSDLLADDWEIEEPTVTITRAQFWEAVRASKPVEMRFTSSNSFGPSGVGTLHTTHAGQYLKAEELARQLGLEP